MTLSAPASLSKIHADWPAPQHIVAFTTCRDGGSSLPPFDSLNLGTHVGDLADTVKENRERLSNSCEGLEHIQWLNQVHGNRAVNASTAGTLEADSCYTQQMGLACAVMTADCLPVLICDNKGQQVAAAHAGWRGLFAGVIEKTIGTFSVSAPDLLVWLGPAISKAHFEVGPEVRQQFIDSTPGISDTELDQAFVPSCQHNNHYFADLYQLARIRLRNLGVRHVYAGEYCCFTHSRQFFSYRRDNITGRMVSLIYKRVE